MIFARGSADTTVAICKLGGCIALISSFASYVTTTWARMVFSRVAAKKRAELANHHKVMFWIEKKKRETEPCMRAKSKRQILSRGRGKLTLPIFIVQVDKSEWLERVGILIESLVAVQTLCGRDNQCSFWYASSV